MKLLSLALPLVAGQGCIDPETFTFLNFDQTAFELPYVARNDLGGIAGGVGAGPFLNPGETVVPQANSLTFYNVGRAKTGGPADGHRLGVRFTVIPPTNNVPAEGLTHPHYRASNSNNNGYGNPPTGRFGTINVRSPGTICVLNAGGLPCTGTALGESQTWRPDLTFTDFLMEIIDLDAGGALLDITGTNAFRSFITLYDFDAQGQNGGAANNPAESFAVECMQAEAVGVGGTILETTSVAHYGLPTLLVQHPATDLDTWINTDGSYPVGSALRPTGFAGRPIYCANTNPATGYGTSANNPDDPLNLNTEQKQRSLSIDIQNTASIRMRYIVRNGLAETGRNFLFGGAPPLPICQTIQFDPHFFNAHGDYYDFKGKHQTVYNLLSHQSVSVNALFEHVDYVEAGDNHRTVHGSYMRAAYVNVRAPNGKHVLVEYSSRAAKNVLVGIVDAADVAHPPMNRMRLASGWSRTLEDVASVRFNGKTLSVATKEWTITIENHVKPGIINATTCATGKCFVNVNIVPNFNADTAKVAPHGLVGQSYDGDDVGVIGNTDSYVTRGNETTTEAMGEGAIEGVADDYEMASAFATDFKYSRFGLTEAKPRDVSALTGKKIKKGDRTAADVASK